MSISGSAIVVSITAWDATNNVGQTGLTLGTFSLAVDADGSTLATGLVATAELGNGEYSVTLTGAYNTGTMMSLRGTYAGFVIIPAKWSNLPASGMPETAKTANLPAVAAGAANGLPLLGGTNTIYVATGGNDTTGNGVSFATAYATIAKAISVAISGSLISLGPGTWTVTASLKLPDNTHLQGMGRGVSAIQGSGSFGGGNVVSLGNGCTISDCSVIGDLAQAVSPICLQTAAGGNLTGSCRLERTHLLGAVDAIVGNSSAVVYLYDSLLESTWDTTAFSALALIGARNVFKAIGPNSVDNAYTVHGHNGPVSYMDDSTYIAENAKTSVGGSTGLTVAFQSATGGDVLTNCRFYASSPYGTVQSVSVMSGTCTLVGCTYDRGLTSGAINDSTTSRVDLWSVNGTDADTQLKADVAAQLTASGVALTSQLTAGFQTVNNNLQLLRTATSECTVVIPDDLFIPPTGTTVYWLDVYFQDANNTPFDPDSNAVTVHASLMDGTSVDARLVNATYPTDATTGATALARIAAGHYRGYVYLTSTDTEQPISFGGSYNTTAPAWVTATNYVVGQIAANSGSNYKCLVNHTSGTFATDLAANDWVAVSVTKNFGGVVNLLSLTSQATIAAVKSQTDKLTFDGSNNVNSSPQTAVQLAASQPNLAASGVATAANQALQATLANQTSQGTGTLATATAVAAIPTTAAPSTSTIVTALIADGVLQYVSGTSGPLQLTTTALAKLPPATVVNVESATSIESDNERRHFGDS